MRALCIILVLACLHGGAANARAAGAKPHIVFTLTGARAALPRCVAAASTLPDWSTDTRRVGELADWRDVGWCSFSWSR